MRLESDVRGRLINKDIFGNKKVVAKDYLKLTGVHEIASPSQREILSSQSTFPYSTTPQNESSLEHIVFHLSFTLQRTKKATA